MGEERYLRVTQEQEIEERIGSEEVNYWPAQAPACACEDRESSNHKENGAWQGDFTTLWSLQMRTSRAGVRQVTLLLESKQEN